MMNKPIAFVMLSVLVLPAVVRAEVTSAGQNIKLNGFIDVVYTLSDSTDEMLNEAGDSIVERKFNASGEVDLETSLNDRTMLRFDLDLNSRTVEQVDADDDGQPDFQLVTEDSGRFEQAFANYVFDQDRVIKAGIFNNPLGFEKEDAPDMYQTTHSQLWDIWDEQTALNGNNLAGVELAANVNIVSLYAGLLNDLNDSAEKNSFMIAAQVQPDESLDIVAGLITADNGNDHDAKAGNLFDVSATWKKQQLMLGGELLTADQIYDMGMQVTANYAFTDTLSATARFDYVDYDASFDKTTSITLGGLLAVADNLFVNGEVRVMQNDDDADSAKPNPYSKVGDGSVISLELVGTF